VLAALILAAAALRLPGLGAASLWLDECSSIETALAVARSTSWAVMRALFRGLSAYTLLLAPWIERDVSEWAARLPSVVAGIALVPIAWLLGKEIGGRPLAWRLGAAVALSPFFVWHSREARWYPLTWLLAGIGTLYFLRALRRPAGSSLAGCLGFGLAAASTFSPAVTLLFVEIPWIAAVHRADPAVSSPAAPGARLALRLALCVLGVLGIAWLWLALLAPALRIGSRGFGFSNLGGPRVGAVLYVPVALATGYTIGPGPLEWHSRPLRLPAVPESLTMLAAVAIVTMLLVLGYREIAASRRRSRATALLTLGIVPPVMLVAASLWTDHRFAPRHVGMSFLCLLCLAAAGTLRPPGRKPLGPALGAALLVLQGVSLVNLHTSPRYHREDVRSAAAYVSQASGPEDRVLIFGGIGLPWKHYYSGAAPWEQVSSKPSRGFTEAVVLETARAARHLFVVRGLILEDSGEQSLLGALDGATDPLERHPFEAVEVVRRRASKAIPSSRPGEPSGP
jgi:4-amino-4-deoxy-L-arabinose transferase-like glycosyltransferase